MQSTDQPVLAVSYHRGKALFACIALLVLLLVTAALLYDAVENGVPDSRPIRALVVYTAVMAVTSALALPAFAMRLLSSGPVLQLGPHGLCYHRWSASMVPWTAVSRLEGKRQFAQHSLSIWLADPDAWPAGSAAARLVSRLDRNFGGADITIPLSGLDMTPQSILEVSHRSWVETQR
ncbi:MAG: hypothetical protein H6918_06555 [Sphingomonadaceae bacterium]|nr:hypothetical protein [Sphingomonadaceae bacterium]